MYNDVNKVRLMWFISWQGFKAHINKERWCDKGLTGESRHILYLLLEKAGLI